MRRYFTALFFLPALQATAQVYSVKEPLVHTFSIVARDSITGEMAVGVQSHWFSVGTAVTWGEAGVGVVATQSFVDKSYGPKALALIKEGFTAPEALDKLTAQDSGKSVRQVAIIDVKGNVATHTGSNCIQYASHITGNDFSVQSNMMLGSKVSEAMAAAFRASSGKPLAERVLLALEAAQNAGGDIRGMQSAALIVVPGVANGQPWNDKLVDLRVDDHSKPLAELRRLYKVHLAYQHMNNGDLAMEKQDMELAMKEYNAAMKMFPTNLEMQYWTAIALANTGKMDKALPMFKKIFAADKNWKELTRRLPAVNLLKVNEAGLKKVLAQ
jgi:uncharacterized Ntn-hydrolase superfamily protein